MTGARVVLVARRPGHYDLWIDDKPVLNAVRATIDATEGDRAVVRLDLHVTDLDVELLTDTADIATSIVLPPGDFGSVRFTLTPDEARTVLAGRSTAASIEFGRPQS